jgi:hypothetical protein
MRTPTSAVHYGSMVLHNFIATCRSPGHASRARYIIAHPEKAAIFGRRVVNEDHLHQRSLTHRDLYVLLSDPI